MPLTPFAGINVKVPPLQMDAVIGFIYAFGLTVTFLVALVVPQRPVEVAVIVTAPKNAASQFITPVAGFIVPAAAGATLYDIEMLLAAVAA